MDTTVQPELPTRSSGDVQIPRLKEWRDKRALSQEALAKLAKLDRSTIIHLEGGRSAWPKTRLKLAKALRIDPADLL